VVVKRGEPEPCLAVGSDLHHPAHEHQLEQQKSECPPAVIPSACIGPKRMHCSQVHTLIPSHALIPIHVMTPSACIDPKSCHDPSEAHALIPSARLLRTSVSSSHRCVWCSQARGDLRNERSQVARVDSHYCLRWWFSLVKKGRWCPLSPKDSKKSRLQQQDVPLE
jgi:hypothetical protein